jgi:trk system potassium uptake protein TrkA
LYFAGENMTIIIAGAGRVGFRLARTLSTKHNVIIMDQNEEALKRLNESIDALTLYANVEDPKSYESLAGKKYDLFIAVTDSDEINLVCSLIANEKIEVNKTVIRLKNQFFAKSSIASKIGITDAVFPLAMVAHSLQSLSLYPGASSVKCFKNLPFKLISVKASFEGEDSIPVENLSSEALHIVGVDRQKTFFIPTQRDQIRTGDTVYCFGDPETIQSKTASLHVKPPKSVKTAVIFGASDLGVTLAQALIDQGVAIKLIEKDVVLCNQAANQLQHHATVINSKYGDFHLFEEEGLLGADMLVAATPNDNENIVKCIEAKSMGIGRVIAINNDIEHYRLMHTLGIVALRGPKMNAFYAIMEIINSNINVDERLFCGGSAICFTRHFQSATKPSLLNNAKTLSFCIQDGHICSSGESLDKSQPFSIVAFTDRQNEESVRTWINAS